MLDTRNIYINSFQACDIYDHQYGKPISTNFVGMIPFSLESMKFQSIGMNVYEDRRDKLRSNDVINLKFDYGSKDYMTILGLFDQKKILKKNKEMRLTLKDELLKATEKKKLKYAIEENKKLLNYLDRIKEEERPSMSSDKLREFLYTNGFTYNGVEYVVYKRTTAKSRTGQVQFVNKKFKVQMLKWARLGMNVDGMSRDDGIDYPSLLSYESLPSSSIIDIMTIDTKSILIVDDVISAYRVKANVIEKDDTGYLTSRLRGTVRMESDLFDGESLIEATELPEGKGCALLRNLMFKTCAFATHIQKFYKDYCDENHIDYNTFKIKDMFGNEMLAKDIKLITTPNSLKALKFSKRKRSKSAMYNHWKKRIEMDDCIFGICKYEKESKRGKDKLGRIVNRTSYQILNSMPFSPNDIRKMAEMEINALMELKENDDVYMDYLMQMANDINTNETIHAIASVNKNFLQTTSVRQKRKIDIFGFKRNVQRGRVRLVGDYCVICQNPKEFLYHSIGKLPMLGYVNGQNKSNELDYDQWSQHHELIKNQAHFTQHEFGREYSAFRSPHTAPSNVLVLENKKSDFIEKYMQPSKNIVYTNSINFEINRILSGQDADSDAIVIFDNEVMLSIAKRCFNEYHVCENKIEASPVDYKVCPEDMAKIDNILSTSQMNIGEIVNLGQICASKYWHSINNRGARKAEIKQLLDNVNICTILSEVAIDLAKKMYDIDMGAQIKRISQTAKSNEKPKFFKNITKNKNAKTRYMDTSMDYLYKTFERLPSASRRKNVNLRDLLKKIDMKTNKKTLNQKQKVLQDLSIYLNERTKIFAEYSKDTSDTALQTLSIKHEIMEHDFLKRIGRLKLSQDIMYLLILEVAKANEMKKTDVVNDGIDRILKSNTLVTLDMLYKMNKNVFISIFKHSNT